MKKIFILLLVALGVRGYGQTLTVRINNAVPGISAANIQGWINDSIANMRAGVFNVSAFGLSSLDSVSHVYYVSNSGSDTNNGLTPNSPFAHHPWMSTWAGSITLVAGDVVLMKRGDTWSISNPVAAYMTVAQSGTNGRHIVTGAYGIGEKPLIKIVTATAEFVIYATSKSYLVFNGLHIQHNSSTYSDWTTTGGFQFDGCHDVVVSGNEIDNIPGCAIRFANNGWDVVVGDTTQTKTATSLSYSNNIHDFGYAAIGFEGTNPADNISNQYAYYNYIHDGTGAAVNNEYAIYFSVTGSSTDWPKYGYARYNYVEDVDHWESIECHGGSYLYFQDNRLKNFAKAFPVFNVKTGALTSILDHIYIERNIMEQKASGWNVAAGDFIIQGSSTDDTTATNIFIRDNTLFFTSKPATNVFAGISIGRVDTAIISGNIMYNGSDASGTGGIRFYSSHAFGVKNVTVSDNYISGWAKGLELKGTLCTGLITVNNNIVLAGTGDTPLFLTTAVIPSGGDVRLYNNIIFTKGAQCPIKSYGVASGGSLKIKNNIIGSTASYHDYYILLVAAPVGTFECDYNIYWNSDLAATTPFYINGNVSWDDWKIATYDANSPNTTATLDPIFKNASGDYSLRTDFELKNTSPAINEGVDVDIDYLGTSADIGAKEKR